MNEQLPAYPDVGKIKWDAAHKTLGVVWYLPVTHHEFSRSIQLPVITRHIRAQSTRHLQEVCVPSPALITLGAQPHVIHQRVRTSSVPSPEPAAREPEMKRKVLPLGSSQAGWENNATSLK